MDQFLFLGVWFYKSQENDEDMSKYSCRSITYSTPDASSVSHNGKICIDMEEGIDFKMLSTTVIVCLVWLIFFFILIDALLCRTKVTLLNGGRKKEIRSVLPKVSYDSASSKLVFVQSNVLRDNC